MTVHHLRVKRVLTYEYEITTENEAEMSSLRLGEQNKSASDVVHELDDKYDAGNVLISDAFGFPVASFAYANWLD